MVFKNHVFELLYILFITITLSMITAVRALSYRRFFISLQILTPRDVTIVRVQFLSFRILRNHFMHKVTLWFMRVFAIAYVGLCIVLKLDD